MLNEVKLIGRIANDLELISYGDDQTRCTFSLAVETAYGTDFPRVTVFGKKASNLVKYNNKGDLIYVDAFISTKKTEKNGQVKFYENIVANSISYLNHKKSNEDAEAETVKTESLKEVFENSNQQSEDQSTVTFERQKAKGFENEDLPY
ncbi:single-stranded DNA-binding protein [Staphylococcus aureus]|nr:single-stranded DNA-binding protein [Staphylococcus aureus]HDH6438650.1 single-stranded DNA-binding protein [Staphylococcus aureus MRSA-Lux-28]MVJ15624.1 single-stranded DNA-binding protein [Staphylococcus aureus]HCX2122100.1 single-stranded DNA-binding protein [Staphylococcus aureus]HCX2122774.1 single-stranded DNA-binding protein [Staphylococcus aureus]